ncbi:zinc-ribbon domain-containing protein [Bifidobacterium sp. SMB2]|uniref:Zinc-ribbon domain-containing protein n=1 Tax=Bifidobacterium saimiriisciurei TaxID=2661627 RepID=A0ABX0CBT0_9BIFI|nr:MULTISPECIES: zinc ribbon domain-containing protein [Bifidobacterium]NEG96460.1 zinc-ribbon domain-containing protein [Bifidobacterium sp. SMB2]NEH12548.1 zinc-ribbon domain-containing protein [Bifidobacterium saimiriisciurei]
MSQFCHKCGAEVPNDSLFCPKCGAKLDSIAEKNEVHDPADVSVVEQRQSDGVEEFDVESDGEIDQGRHDVVDESARNATSNADAEDPHWWNRSDNQADQAAEAAREQRVEQREQKWNRRRIIVIAVAALIVIAVIVGAVLSSRSNKQPNKSQEASSGSESASKCVAVSQSSGSIYDRSCDSDSEDNPSATLRYLFKQLSSKTEDDESLQLGGRNTSTDGVPYLFISSTVENLNRMSGALWNFGYEIGTDPLSSDFIPMISQAIKAEGSDFLLKSSDFEKLTSLQYKVPYYRFTVKNHGDVILGLIAYGLDNSSQTHVDVFVYDADDLPDWMTDIHDSNQTNQSDSSTSSSSVTGGQDDSSSEPNADHGTPDDAVGYDKYKDYNCFVGVTGAVAPCSFVYKTMKDGDVNYLPFGMENNPDPSNSSGYIPVDENQNGIRDSDE